MRSEAEAGEGWSGNKAACCSLTELAYAYAEGAAAAGGVSTVGCDVASGELVELPSVALVGALPTVILATLAPWPPA